MERHCNSNKNRKSKMNHRTTRSWDTVRYGEHVWETLVQKHSDFPLHQNKSQRRPLYASCKPHVDLADHCCLHWMTVETYNLTTPNNNYSKDLLGWSDRAISTLCELKDWKYYFVCNTAFCQKASNTLQMTTMFLLLPINKSTAKLHVFTWSNTLNIQSTRGKEESKALCEKVLVDNKNVL